MLNWQFPLPTATRPIPQKAPQQSAPSSEELSTPCLFTSGDIARLLDVDLKTVHNWVRLGHLFGLKTKGGHWRFHRSEVIRFMRRFGYPVPSDLGGVAPRLAIVAKRTVKELPPLGDVHIDVYERLFDAVLVIASGMFDIIVVDLDVVNLHQVVDFVAALRRRELTNGVVVVGMSGTPGVRDAFIQQGGDIVIHGDRELPNVVSHLTGR